MLNLFNINGLSQNVNFCANKSSQTNKQTKEFLKKCAAWPWEQHMTSDFEALSCLRLTRIFLWRVKGWSSLFSCVGESWLWRHRDCACQAMARTGSVNVADVEPVSGATYPDYLATWRQGGPVLVFNPWRPYTDRRQCEASSPHVFSLF